jgi:hypothetical protein
MFIPYHKLRLTTQTWFREFARTRSSGSQGFIPSDIIEELGLFLPEFKEGYVDVPPLYLVKIRIHFNLHGGMAWVD